MSNKPENDFSSAWVEHRAYVVDLAFRMLGNIQDAEDVVQEAFGRLLANAPYAIDDVRGWLVVVVSRLCLDQLGSARVRREARATSLEDQLDSMPAPPVGLDPADRVTLDDSIHMALLVVLQRLTPSERAVFVLHDLFQFSFDAVAGIVGRTPAACRQLASRARKHVDLETGPARFDPETGDPHRVAQRFIAACAGGDLDALVQVLDPNVVGEVELGAAMPKRRPVSGALAVARNALGIFGPNSGLTLVSQPVNGNPGVLAFRHGQLFALIEFKTRAGVIYDIHGIADPAKLVVLQRQLAPAAT